MTEAHAKDLSPTDYGWYADNSLLKPTWFEGPATPDCLFEEDSTNGHDIENEDDGDAVSEPDDELDVEVWSENSDSQEEDDH